MSIKNYTTSELLEIELKTYIKNKYGENMQYKGEIIKIHPLKPTRYGNKYYRRIEVKLDNGDWVKTDIVQGFRNAKRWQIGIDYGVGARVTGIELKSNGTINADSYVKFKKN